MKRTTNNMSSTTSYRTTNSSPKTVALATTLTNQKARRSKTNNEPRSQDARKQIAIDCLNSSTLTRNATTEIITKMDVKTIDNLAAVDSSAETTELIQRWKEIVKPGIYRMTGEKWKKYHEPKFLRNERRVIEERLQQNIRGREQGDLRQRIGPQHSGGFQPQTRRSEQ